MDRIRYQVGINDSRKSRVDALQGKSIFWYKTRLHNLRELYATFIILARTMADLPDHTGVLILDETKLSISRLRNEWNSLDKLFQSSIHSRLCMVVFSGGSIIEDFGNLSNEETTALSKIQEKLSEKHNKKKPRKPDAFFEILRILLIHWFRGNGPLQMNELGKLTGYSYPTVAASLEKLEHSLLRHSDRSVELRSFPRDDWFKLVAMADDIRAPRGYHAHRPRSLEDIIERLKEKTENDIACGGIVGARHYLPGIDLVGTPRIDICVHDWGSAKIDKLIRRLDPGLKKAEPGQLPQVVVHSIYRPVSLFSEGDRFKVADEVECLLDLHEARLESQALELLEHLKGKVKK